MKKFLIVLSGISVSSYGISLLISNKEIWEALCAKYGTDNIFEPDYNKYLDTWTIQNEFNLKYLDPLRLKLNPFRKSKILKCIENIIKQKQKEGYSVDCLCHSQGCWVLSMCDVEVDKVIFTGSPIGFKDNTGRFLVRQSIAPFPWSKPKLKCNTFINLYSDNDYVGHFPVTKEKKWRFKAENTKEIMTFTKHGFDEYTDFAYKAKLLV